MPSILLEFRLRIRNATDTADDLVVTSVRGDALPYLQSPPRGDGSSLDPYTGRVQSGVYIGRIIDAITGGTNRVITSLYNDVNGRPQLGLRKTYWEFRENGGAWLNLSSGLLTKLTPASDVEWDVASSEAMMLEHQVTSFAPKQALIACTANAAIGATALAVAALPFLITSGTTLYFSGFKAATLTADAAAGATALAVSALGVAINNGENATALEPIDAFLTRWPQRGCLAGGPVRGGFLKQRDLGGWEMQVAESQGNLRWLKFIAGYGPPDFKRTLNPKDVVPKVVEAADKFYKGLGAVLAGTTQFRTIEETRRAYPWGSLILEIVGVGYFQPAQLARFNNLDVGKDDRYRQIAKADIKPGFFINAPGIATGGTVYRVRLFSIEVSEQSPIYWTGHPVDYMAKLWDEQGFAYDAASLTTVRNALGTQRRISVRKTETVDTGQELEAMVYGPLGVGVRMNSTNQLQAFVSRIFASPAPAIQLNDVDVVQGTTRLGELDTAGAIRRVIVSHKRLVTAQDAAANHFDGSSALDGFLEQDETMRQENGDPGAVGQNEQTYNIPGMIHLVDQDPDLRSFSGQLAKEVFDRRGRGSVKGSTTAIRNGSGDPLNIGDEVLVAVKQLPNKNKRYVDDNTVGARRMQVVRVTPQTIGKELDLEDSGANANALVTQPTLAIAQSADLPRTVAELTITNAAALNAANIGARVRVATSTGVAPATTDYADVIAFQPGQIPTGAIRLPAVKAGLTVFAIARSEQQGAQPSAYSAAVNVALAALNAPTAVLVTPSGADGSLATVAWTIGAGASDLVTDVFVRAQGDPVANAVRRITLEAGSTQYVLEHLTPGANYTASVQHRDPFTGDVSALVDVNFTAGATVVTLATPLNPQGFVGTIDPSSGVPKMDGRYGLSVRAVVLPSFVEFFEATETGVGTGAYGAFVSVGKIPSVQGNWTTYENVAPNDGLRRQLEARHVKDGGTSSGFTAPVTVSPWATVVRQPPYLDPSQGVTLSVLPDGSVDIHLNGASVHQSWRYAWSTSSQPSAASALAGTVVVGRQATVNVAAGLALGDVIYVTAVPFEDAAGTAFPGQIVAVKASRQNKSTPKTIRIQASFFAPRDSTTPIGHGVGAVAPSAKALCNAYASLIAPIGVPLTGWRARLKRQNGNGVAKVEFYKIDDNENATLIDTLTHSGSGRSTLSNTLSETVDGVSTYTALLTLDTTLATNANDNELLWVEFDYTPAALDQSI